MASSSQDSATRSVALPVLNVMLHNPQTHIIVIVRKETNRSEPIRTLGFSLLIQHLSSIFPFLPSLGPPDLPFVSPFGQLVISSPLPSCGAFPYRACSSFLLSLPSADLIFTRLRIYRTIAILRAFPTRSQFLPSFLSLSISLCGLLQRKERKVIRIRRYRRSFASRDLFANSIYLSFYLSSF